MYSNESINCVRNNKYCSNYRKHDIRLDLNTTVDTHIKYLQWGEDVHLLYYKNRVLILSFFNVAFKNINKLTNDVDTILFVQNMNTYMFIFRSPCRYNKEKIEWQNWSNLRPSTLAEVLDVLINLFIITFARRILYHSYVLVSCSIKEKEVYKHLNMKMLAPEMCPNIEVLYRLPCPMPINPCIPFVSTKNNR